MNQQKSIRTLAVALVAFFSGVILATSIPAFAQKRTARPYHQFKQVLIHVNDMDVEGSLQEMGNNGWDLVTVVPMGGEMVATYWRR